MNQQEKEDWSLIIRPDNSWFNLKLREIWRYRDLIAMFVRRDIVTIYKQTILGPLWFFIQPILTTIVFVVIFGRVAKISTDGIPHVLFYLSGITIWNYFAETFRLTSDVFKKNEQIFGKVYFPRSVVPLSIVISNLIKFGIQLLLFLSVLIYFLFEATNINLQIELLFLPFLIMFMGILGLGFGMLISSMTSKYRDLTFLIQFGIQLLMYATPIVYPASIVVGQYKILLWLNPMTSIVEAFRFMFLGQGIWSWEWLFYSMVFSVGLFLISLAVFNKTEKNFVDTV